jgi:alpha-amylase
MYNYLKSGKEMKSICLFFQVHQPIKYRRYRFFDIGNDHYYYDDYSNETSLRKVNETSYLPANKLLLNLILKHKGKLKVSFSITGVALDQFEIYAPEVILSFKKLADTGCVEFLSETYSHSLSSLRNQSVFEKEVQMHSDRIYNFFGQKPQVFRNTEMIYSDEIGAQVYQMGYKAILTEGARHVLGWKSPNFLYVNAINPRMKVLMRNFKLSDDISFRFSNQNWSEFPLTAEKFTSWLHKLQEKEEVINLFLSYESFGVRQPENTGIFKFLEHWVNNIVTSNNFKFATPSEVIHELQPVSLVSVPQPISWADEERDLTSWLGNEMQKEAFEKLYSLAPLMEKCQNEELIRDWKYLQESDHFYFMSTKYFSGNQVLIYQNPFDSPYEAFINYMNILSDFAIRLNMDVQTDDEGQDAIRLQELLQEKEKKIRTLEIELEKLKKKIPLKNRTVRKNKAK